MTEATSNLGISASRCPEILIVDNPIRFRMDSARLMIAGDAVRAMNEIDVDQPKT